MALQKTINTAHGFQATSAYHRIEGLTLDSKTQISFKIRSYVATDKPSFDEKSYQCAYDLSGDNPIAQAYVYAKKTSDFSDATDV